MKFIKFLLQVGFATVLIGLGFWVLSYTPGFDTMYSIPDEELKTFATSKNLFVLIFLAIVIGAILKKLSK